MPRSLSTFWGEAPFPPGPVSSSVSRAPATQCWAASTGWLGVSRLGVT